MLDYKVIVSSEKGVDINPGMFGLFFEDINYAADGGLYAEMIENRSFECVTFCRDQKRKLERYDYAWGLIPYGSRDADFAIEDEMPLNTVNPHYLRLNIHKNHCVVGLTNQSYDGLSLKAGARYFFTVYVRTEDYDGEIRVSLEKNGRIYAFGTIGHVTREWKQYELNLVSSETVSGARLVIRLSKAGSVCFDVVSLFPEDTYKKRRNGLRKDLVEMLADIHPGFIRFPGGCIIEGYNLDNRYNWKDTVGDIAVRKQNYNRWQDNAEHKFDYYCQTYGLGFYEYFLLCEDIGAKPLPVVNCGMGCQFQTGDWVEVESKKFRQYIQDALDLVEFANGSEDTEWGALRAEMGHPEPFHMDMIGIGNEQWDTPENQFHQRYEAFQQAFAKEHPEIKLVGTSGPAPDDDLFAHAWEYLEKKAKELKTRKEIDAFAFVIDEHFYRTPEWFYAHTDRYDAYDRNSFYVFAGEYAAHDRDENNHNNLNSALAEAAMLTGFERNADVVRMAAYAPLFAREGYVQWKPDMIWFNVDKAYATPNYHVQKMYGNHTGSYTLKTKVEGPEQEERFYSSVCFDEKTADIIVKLVNPQAESKNVTIMLDEGYQSVSPVADAEVLCGEQMTDYNTLQEPNKVSAERFMITNVNEEFVYEMPKHSFTVIRIHTK